MTNERIRTRVAPIGKYKPFGCMTIPVAIIAAVVALRFVFAEAPRRWWRSFTKRLLGY